MTQNHIYRLIDVILHSATSQIKNLQVGVVIVSPFCIFHYLYLFLILLNNVFPTSEYFANCLFFYRFCQKVGIIHFALFVQAIYLIVVLVNEVKFLNKVLRFPELLDGM